MLRTLFVSISNLNQDFFRPRPSQELDPDGDAEHRRRRPWRKTPWHHNRREPSYRSEGTVTFRLRLGYRGIVSEVDCFCSLGSITLARYRQGVAMLP